MALDPLLDHLERTFAEAYRKELDQEENVWRSLPFFAATLALELAALAQVREWIAGATGPILALALALLSVAGVATLAAIILLALSVWPANYRYVGREPELRIFANDLRLEPGADSEDALRAVKTVLAEQYATAADNNRKINQRRAKWRTRAGLATLASVFVVLVLAALVVVSNIHGHARP